MYLVRFIVIILFVIQANSYADNALDEFAQLQNSSLLVVSEKGESVYSKNADQLWVPASTVKLLTALMAIDHWGRDFRFSTQFYTDNENNLIVKGFGDPFLVSEELDLIVNELHALGINQISGIAIDTSYFQDKIIVSGQGRSNNPYDAAVGALAANFNTVEVRVNKSGVTSGESQTPITPLATALAKTLPAGKHRINLGKAEYSGQYFVELFTAKLHAKNISVLNENIVVNKNNPLQLLYTHYNSRSLHQVISAMLEYSNNYIANQLYLMMGAEKFGAPAAINKSQQYAKDYVEQHFDWPSYLLADGAGLSRENRLSARQLVEVLHKFTPHQDLMPIQNNQIYAKSGTMRGVSSYAGYLLGDKQALAFAMLINQPVRYRFREQLAVELLRQFEE